MSTGDAMQELATVINQDMSTIKKLEGYADALRTWIKRVMSDKPLLEIARQVHERARSGKP